jgi:hypothetical protein
MEIEVFEMAYWKSLSFVRTTIGTENLLEKYIFVFV